MRRALLTTGVLVVALAAVAPAAECDQLQAALARLQERYDATRTLTAKFHQTVESPALAGVLESHGTLAFEKPNRMRWDYAAPDPQVIVGDGETLWIYQPEDRQVLKAPLGEAFQAATPITFLAGLGKLERDFEASLARDDEAHWELTLVPREGGGVGTLTLVVRKEDAEVREARVTDALGTTTRLRLSEERRNVTLDPTLFRFTPPDGVDVVRPPTY